MTSFARDVNHRDRTLSASLVDKGRVEFRIGEDVVLTATVADAVDLAHQLCAIASDNGDWLYWVNSRSKT